MSSYSSPVRLFEGYRKVLLMSRFGEDGSCERWRVCVVDAETFGLVVCDR